MAEVRTLHSIEQLDQFVGEPGKRLLFKHSTVCPISDAAHQEFLAFLEERAEMPAAVILVREDRPVSNEVERRYGIKHESPQIFLIEDGRVTWHASHWKITKPAIAAAIQD